MLEIGADLSGSTDGDFTRNVSSGSGGGFSADVTDALRPGTNTLRVKITNLWPNRLIDDECLPADCEWNTDGQLRAWPQWLLARPAHAAFATDPASDVRRRAEIKIWDGPRLGEKGNPHAILIFERGRTRLRHDGTRADGHEILAGLASRLVDRTRRP